MVFEALGFTIDISGLAVVDGLDASRWAGKIKIARDADEAEAGWNGAEGSVDGMICDVEAEGEFLADVERAAEEISLAISSRLEDPCSPEERRELGKRAEWFDEGAERAGRRAA